MNLAQSVRKVNTSGKNPLHGGPYYRRFSEMKRWAWDLMPVRNFWTLGRSNLSSLLQFFVEAGLACPSLNLDFLFWNQVSSNGAQAPKLIPEVFQAEGFGHQLSNLTLWPGTTPHEYSVHALLLLDLLDHLYIPIIISTSTSLRVGE